MSHQIYYCNNIVFSGGPLFVEQNKNEQRLLGVLSTGYERSTTMVYSNLTHFSDFLNDKLQSFYFSFESNNRKQPNTLIWMIIRV